MALNLYVEISILVGGASGIPNAETRCVLKKVMLRRYLAIFMMESHGRWRPNVVSTREKGNEEAGSSTQIFTCIFSTKHHVLQFVWQSGK